MPHFHASWHFLKSPTSITTQIYCRLVTRGAFSLSPVKKKNFKGGWKRHAEIVQTQFADVHVQILRDFKRHIADPKYHSMGLSRRLDARPCMARRPCKHFISACIQLRVSLPWSRDLGAAGMGEKFGPFVRKKSVTSNVTNLPGGRRRLCSNY